MKVGGILINGDMVELRAMVERALHSLLIALLLASGWFLFTVRPIYADEYCHFKEAILPIVEARWLGHPECVLTLPTYHFLTAGLMKLLSWHSLLEARAANAFWAFSLLWLAFSWRQNDTRWFRWFKSLQLGFFPLLMPYFFLTYTDTLSLLVVLLSLYLHEGNWRKSSAFIHLISVAVRQTQIIWLMFCLVWDLRRFASDRETRFGSGQKFIVVLLRWIWPELVVLAIFGAVVMWLGRLTVSSGLSHPSFVLRLENVWLFFALLPVLFLPYLLNSIPRLVERMRQEWLGMALVVAALGFLFSFTWHVDHPFNNPGQFDVLFIHNWAVEAISQNLWLRISTFVAIILGIWLLIDWPFLKSEHRWFIPFGLLMLALHWLIETRYQLPLLAFLLLQRRASSRSLELAQFFYQLVFSFAIFWLLITTQLFL
jgi:alpha-1,2-glucosyltransferase